MEAFYVIKIKVSITLKTMVILRHQIMTGGHSTTSNNDRGVNLRRRIMTRESFFDVE